MPRKHRRVSLDAMFLTAFLIAMVLLAGVASAAAQVDPVLEQRLGSGPGPHDVVITFRRPADSSALIVLGANFIPLRQLPMAGARLTTAQVRAVQQVEQILAQTADPMPGYAFHEVGAGYVDVREAVEIAIATQGERAAFLAGDTAW